MTADNEMTYNSGTKLNHDRLPIT